MPVTKEVLIERVRYLRDVQRSLEGAVKEAVAIVVATPILNIFLRYPLAFLTIAVAATLFTSYALYSIFKIQVEVKSIWEELMRKDPIYERLPPIVVFGILMCVASIIALILTW